GEAGHPGDVDELGACVGAPVVIHASHLVRPDAGSPQVAPLVGIHEDLRRRLHELGIDVPVVGAARGLAIEAVIDVAVGLNDVEPATIGEGADGGPPRAPTLAENSPGASP